MTPRSRDQGQTNNAIHLSHLQMIIFSPPAHCGQVMASVGQTRVTVDPLEAIANSGQENAADCH